jgi:hypothetical protein
MTRVRRRWDPAPLPAPKRPYRDTAIFHVVLAALIVVVALVTGGDLGNAIAIAIAFFLLATAWSWSRWRKKLREQAQREPGRQEARP